MRSKFAPLAISMVISGAMVVLASLPGCSTTAGERLYAAESAASLAQQAALTYLETHVLDAAAKTKIKAASAVLTDAIDAGEKASRDGDNAALAAELAGVQTAITHLNIMIEVKP